MSQIVLPKDDLLAQQLGDLIGAVELHEIAVQQIGGEAGDRGEGVDATPGERDRLLVEVCGEDLHIEALKLIPQRLRHQDRERIRLLTSRAARRPDTQLIAALARLRDEVGERLLPQRREEIIIAEKFRHFDQEGGDEAIVLLRMEMEVVEIVTHIGLPVA